MNMSGKHKLLAIPALAALVCGTLAAGQANAAPAAPDALQPCEGKAQLRAVVLTQTASTSIGETAGVFVPLTDASVSIAGPAAAAATDQLIVTFTGEAALNGQPNVLNPVVDAMQTRILLNGVPLPPGAVAFTTDAGQSDALQACAIVTGPGPHVVTVEWRLFDFANNSALTGTLSSWELHVEQND